MTKFVMYRNNSAYEQFLYSCIIGREGFEMQVFPQGTPETEITGWIAENADRIRSMKEVFMDQTCYKAGEKVPSNQEKRGDIWMDVHYGQLDRDVFQPAAKAVMAKATFAETFAEIVRHLLRKKVPDYIYVSEKNITDHLYMFNVMPQGSDKEAVAEELARIIESEFGKPVQTIRSANELSVSATSRKSRKMRVEAGLPPLPESTTWVFLDRHETFFFEKEEVVHFKVPIENLIQDALAFGIEIDVEAYSQKIREIVAAW